MAMKFDKKAICNTEICKKQAQKNKQLLIKTSPKASNPQVLKKRKPTKNKPKFAAKPQGWQDCTVCFIKNYGATLIVGEKTTVIVTQSPTSHHSVFKKKCFMIENDGKKLSENTQKQIKGNFHSLEVHIKIMTIEKGSRHSLSQPNKSNLLLFPK